MTGVQTCALPISVKVVDAAGQSVTSGRISLVVRAAPALTITTTSLATATHGVAYSATISVTGGTQPYAFGYSGVLPSGLTVAAISPTQVQLAGTPSVAGRFSLTLYVQDATGRTVNRTFSVTVR